MDVSVVWVLPLLWNIPSLHWEIVPEETTLDVGDMAGRQCILRGLL